MENSVDRVNARELVEPSKIEERLAEIWKSLAELHKTRASLFNLIVFTKFTPRTDYIRQIVERVIKNYPSRILFISCEEKTDNSFLKVAISVVPTGEKENQEFFCDNIDIGVTKDQLERVPFLIIPHLLPDLPCYLLWAEDPCQEEAIFSPMMKLSKRIIFDSESAEDLACFAKTVLTLHRNSQKDVADLNWARIEPFRDLIATHFHDPNNIYYLQKVDSITIEYNSKESDFFSHLTIQSLYLSTWLAGRMQLELKEKKKEGDTLLLIYKGEKSRWKVTLSPKEQKSFIPGAILSLTFSAKNDLFSFTRENPEEVIIKRFSEKKCELPLRHLIGERKTGHSLTKEITYRGTSFHYLETLLQLPMNV